MTTTYIGETMQVLRDGEQYASMVAAGTPVRLKDLSFYGSKPVYIFDGLRYAVRRTTAGWETTGETA